MAKTQAQKRELENPGDVSISVAPAAAKKLKPQPPPTNTKTRLATKQAKLDEANTGTDNGATDNNLPAVPPGPADVQPAKPRKRTKQNAPPAGKFVNKPKDINTTTVPPTKPKKSSPPQAPATAAKGTPKKSKASKEPVPTAETAPVLPEPDEDNDFSSPLKKSARVKKPSEIAEKVSQQLAAQKEAKEVKAAEKQKKADAAVIAETPQKTAAFLARTKGQTEPVQASPVLTSPKRQRPTVDRTQALNQLVASQPPLISPSLVSGVSAATGTSTPPSASASCDVSPAAPPHLVIPSSNATSNGASPTTESIVTSEDDYNYDEAVEASTVDINSVLAGIPPLWNIGPSELPPPLTGHIHTAKLKPETVVLIAQAVKDKSKRPRLSLQSFQVKDQKHLLLCIEYMEDFLVNIHGFPDDEMRWIFAVKANYLASKKLNRNYHLTRDSDQYCLLVSRISQVRTRFVAAGMSDGIRDSYEGLGWKAPRGVPQAEWQQTVRAKVTSMVQSGSYLAPVSNRLSTILYTSDISYQEDEPMKYYQHPWIAHVMQVLFWNGAAGKGFSKDHQEHFSCISLPLVAITATAVEKQLAVVAAGPTAANGKHKNAATVFSHDFYMPRLNIHISTLAQLFNSPKSGPPLIAYLKGLHRKFLSEHGAVAAIPAGPKPKLAIPLAGLTNYGAMPEPRDVPKVPAAGPGPAANIDIPAILNNPNLTDEAKVIFMSAIYAAQPPSGSHSSSAQSSRQYEGLWTEVNHDGDDSEAEARRAGALSVPHNRTMPSRRTRATDSDKEMHNGDEGGHEGDGEVNGGSSGQTKDGGEEDSEPEPEQSNAEEGAEAAPADSSMVVLEEGNEGAGTGTSEADSVTESESEDEPAPKQTPTRRFFTDDGDPAPDSATEEEDSDGEGGSGGAPKGDGDKTMRTAVVGWLCLPM
ncbi:hypothetical protein FRC12_024649 [Ceratobasidium sp. 428]|nr:hypothetical protein FRC12_024649 [Ceratobasidium sp. 428]